MAAWESVQVIGIDGTKLTSYGATVTNYSDYHDITIYPSGNPSYNSIIQKMGANYFLCHDRNTCEAGETAVWEEVYNDGTWKITNMSTMPYYERTDSQNRKHYSSRWGIELFYQGSSIGSMSSSTGHRYEPGITPTHVPFTDKACFGFLIDRSRSLGQLLVYEHQDDDDPYYWHQRTRGGIDNRHYNIFIGNMLNYQAVSHITGNNKTYNLSKILTINIGDPVSNAAASNVNLLTESRLDNMINSN